MSEEADTAYFVVFVPTQQVGQNNKALSELYYVLAYVGGQAAV